MTISEMLAYLGYRLDDPNESRYTEAIKLSALNAQQEEVSSLACTGLLTGLQTSKEFQASSAGNTLETNYFRYVNSRLYKLANRGWITKIDIDDIGEIQDNQYTKGTDNNPQCYIWDGKYNLLVTTYGGDYDDVRLYYIKIPTVMIAGGTCQLHVALHNTLCDLAESYLRATYKHGTLEEAITIRQTALKKIGEINAMYKQGIIV